VHAGRARQNELPPAGGLSKLNSVDVEVDVIPGELGHWTETNCISIDRPNAYGSKSSRIP
jgi:hypothetical protein